MITSVLTNGENLNFDSDLLVSNIMKMESLLERNNVIKLVLDKIGKIKINDERNCFVEIVNEFLKYPELRHNSNYEEMIQVYIDNS